MERQKERIQREDRRAGEIVAMLYNLKRGSTEPIEWQDFFPEWKQEEPETDEQMFLNMVAWSKVKPPLPS